MGEFITRQDNQLAFFHVLNIVNEGLRIVRVECIREVVMKFRGREVDEEVYRPVRSLDRIGLRVVVSDSNGMTV